MIKKAALLGLFLLYCSMVRTHDEIGGHFRQDHPGLMHDPMHHHHHMEMDHERAHHNHHSAINGAKEMTVSLAVYIIMTALHIWDIIWRNN